MSELFKNFPKIDIRPKLYGRMDEVRESLEDQTMNMARSAVRLISDNLKYLILYIIYYRGRVVYNRNLKTLLLNNSIP